MPPRAGATRAGAAPPRAPAAARGAGGAPRRAARGGGAPRDSVNDDAAKIGRKTPLRDILPLFVEDADAPVGVVDEENRLEGVVVRGALIAGLTTQAEAQEEGDEGVPSGPEAGGN